MPPKGKAPPAGKADGKTAKADAEAAKVPAPPAKKGTPAPPRYKEGEAPPLPEWPISWSCVGMRLETLLPNLDSEKLVEMVNAIGRPNLSMAIVDAQTMAADEMEVDPATELGNTLKVAKESGDANWLSPLLISNLLDVRSALDKDDEHRREAQRRITTAETCKMNIEETKIKEAEAKTQFEGALLALKEFEDNVRARSATEQRPSFIAAKAAAEVAAAAAAAAAAPVKGKGAPPKKEPASGKGTGPLPTPALSLDEERKVLEDRTAELRVALQCTEQNTKAAMYWDLKGETVKDDPFTILRVYWCLGLGETAEAIANQVSVQSIFRAIFNLAKKHPPPPPPPEIQDDAVAPLKPSASPLAPSQPAPMPVLIAELKALAQLSKIEHPSRNLPILDVLYEDAMEPTPTSEQVEAAPVEVAPAGKGAKAGKGTKAAAPAMKPAVELSLPYEQLAKAVVAASQNLMVQVQAFDALAGNITESLAIPEAVPFKDVNMTYYKTLLDEVPSELVSVPVLLHCLVEQVAVYDCPSEDMEALEVAKSNTRLAKGLESSFQKLGHGLSNLRQPSDFLKDLLERMQVEQEEAEKAKQDALNNTELGPIIEGDLPGVEGRKSQSTLVIKKLEASEAAVGLGQDKRSSQTGSGLGGPGLSRSGSIMQASRPSVVESMDEGISRSSASTTSEETPVSSGGSSTCTLEGEPHLLVVQEFSRVGRLAATAKPRPLAFLDSANVVEVEKRMLYLLAYPGKLRLGLPRIPELSEEKRAASLSALQEFANGGSKVIGQSTGPRYRELDDIYGPPVILEIRGEDDGGGTSLLPANFAAVQRYRKLKMFLDMLLENEKIVLTLEGPIEDTPPDSNATGLDGEDGTEDGTSEEEDDGLTEEERKEKEMEKYLVDCGCPGLKIYRFPTPPPEPDPSEFEPLEQKEPEMFLPFKTIIDRRYVEGFPDGLLGEVHCRAKCLLPYELQKYDRDEDCLLSVLFADERDHEWEGIIASQVSFSDFCSKLDSPSPSMTIQTKHAVYDLEEQYSTILERFRCHLTEEEGLVWCGLPSKSPVQWEPTTTVIKDGIMILLRGSGPADNSSTLCKRVL